MVDKWQIGGLITLGYAHYFSKIPEVIVCLFQWWCLFWWKKYCLLGEPHSTRTEEAEGGTETAVIRALHNTLPPIFQEREVVDNLTKGLVESKAKERGNASSGNAGFERQIAAASRGQGGSWNGPQRTSFKGQPVEGQRGGPMRRSRPRRPIEDRRCYECGGVLGHVSYHCPKL